VSVHHFPRADKAGHEGRGLGPELYDAMASRFPNLEVRTRPRLGGLGADTGSLAPGGWAGGLRLRVALLALTMLR
jgi:hypothetical protein